MVETVEIIVVRVTAQGVIVVVVFVLVFVSAFAEVAPLVW